MGDANQGVRRVVPMSIDQADGQLSNHDWFEFTCGAWVDESEMRSGLWQLKRSVADDVCEFRFSLSLDCFYIVL